ncbi:aldehyde dehydrogenase family protein [Escherichia fergusonii]|nr:aldehyde dehydrogenase family protein [Escherichia fergusonii]
MELPAVDGELENGPCAGGGNCVVLKPARLTPLSVLLLMEIVGDLLPPAW